MHPDAVTRYLQRLPTFVTFFFSVMLVTVFREMGTIFNWTTNPYLDLSNLGDWLIWLSFIATLFFVVAVWLGYALLIERFPYTLHYGHFIFDVARFSVVYMIFDFAFLAGHPPTYYHFIAALGVFHALMAGWHYVRARELAGEAHAEQMADIRGHAMRMGVYWVLALLYFLLVTLRWAPNTTNWTIHAVFVVVTSGLLVFWNARRLNEMRIKALSAQATEAAAKPAN